MKARGSRLQIWAASLLHPTDRVELSLQGLLCHHMKQENKSTHVWKMQTRFWFLFLIGEYEKLSIRWRYSSCWQVTVFTVCQSFSLCCFSKVGLWLSWKVVQGLPVDFGEWRHQTVTWPEEVWPWGGPEQGEMVVKSGRAGVRHTQRSGMRDPNGKLFQWRPLLESQSKLSASTPFYGHHIIMQSHRVDVKNCNLQCVHITFRTIMNINVLLKNTWKCSSDKGCLISFCDSEKISYHLCNLVLVLDTFLTNIPMHHFNTGDIPTAFVLLTSNITTDVMIILLQ